ncbi:unnamed protein product [Closterium sp. NIES-53]
MATENGEQTYSGASRCFFCNSTTLTPLSAPVPVKLADPSKGPVLAHSSIVLPCAAISSGSLSGLYLPSFSTNLVSFAALQDVMVTTTTPGGQRVTICTCTWTGRHQATFTRWPGSSLYTLATEPPEVAVSAQVFSVRSGSTPLLVSPSVAPDSNVAPPPGSPLPATPSWQALLTPCAAPHSPSFPPTTAPLQTLHMNVWGPARYSGQGHECNFLLVVDDYTRYTTVFPLGNKGRVVDVLIPWIRAVRLQLRKWFRQDLPVLRMHSNRGVWYAAHQLNLWPHVSLPESFPTLRWKGKVGDASVFWVWDSRAFVRDTSADKLSARAVPYVFLEPGAGESKGGGFGGAEPGGAEPGGAEPAGVETGGAEPEGVEPGGAESEGAESGDAEPRGTASSGGPAGASL